MVESAIQAIGETDLGCFGASWLTPFIGEADLLRPFLCEVGVRFTAGPFRFSRFFAIRLNLEKVETSERTIRKKNHNQKVVIYVVQIHFTLFKL